MSTPGTPGTPESSRSRRVTGPSMAMYQFGGRMYPLATSATCHVCNSRYRREIEVAIAQGNSYAGIRRSFLARDEEFSVSTQSMKRHYENGHMPMEVEAVRRNLERRALRRGIDIEKGVESLVDGMALAETVVHKAFTRIQSGDLDVDVKDGLAAANLLERFAPVEQSASTEAYAQAFIVYFETAQKIMTPSQFEEFGRRLQADPTLRALIARHAADSPHADHSMTADLPEIEAEVVE